MMPPPAGPPGVCSALRRLLPCTDTEAESGIPGAQGSSEKFAYACAIHLLLAQA